MQGMLFVTGLLNKTVQQEKILCAGQENGQSLCKMAENREKIVPGHKKIAHHHKKIIPGLDKILPPQDKIIAVHKKIIPPLRKITHPRRGINFYRKNITRNLPAMIIPGRFGKINCRETAPAASLIEMFNQN